MSKQTRKPVVILMADDDEDDVVLTRDALQEARVINEFHSVPDGEKLLQFLRHENDYANRKDLPLPGLILLDLNMPKMDGRTVLKIIKNDPDLRTIPVVVLTTSDAEEDIIRSYSLGVNSYIRKPVIFSAMVDLMKTLGTYWLEIVELPPA
ncbi:MAG: response regulator [Magnetococcales bacterium]|nr:response regulator [Magnetococcales bacterium]